MQRSGRVSVVGGLVREAERCLWWVGISGNDTEVPFVVIQRGVSYHMGVKGGPQEGFLHNRPRYKEQPALPHISPRM